MHNKPWGQERNNSLERSWRQAAAARVPHPQTKVPFHPSHGSEKEALAPPAPPARLWKPTARARKQPALSARDKTITINLGSSQARRQTLCRLDSVTRSGWGRPGQVGRGGGRGAFWEAGAFGLPRMGPITAAGWRHCCGGSLPNESVIQLLSERKGRWGPTSVSLTPAVSQTNCSRWKHASKCSGLVNNRVLDASPFRSALICFLPRPPPGSAP